LPETPYKAIGMNFTWQVEPRDTSIEAICRRLFFVPASPIHKFFDVPDGRFGSYLSKDTLGFRLKLTAVPAILGASSSSSADAIILKFNYHYDLAEQTDSVANICDRLARWNEAVAESSQIVSSVAE
jgi:hypothetical protein